MKQQLIHKHVFASSFSSFIALGILLSAALFSGCGSNESSEGWENPNPPNKPVTDPGANWANCSPTPTPVVSPSPAPSTAPSFGDSWWCKTFPWWWGCHSSNTYSLNVDPSTGSTGTSDDTSCKFHNTNFCTVDDQGNVTRQDIGNVDQEGSVVHTVSGGCIARPITEVWEIFLNDSVMKPSDVDEYDDTPRSDLVAQMGAASRVEFAFDIHNVHHALGGLVNPDWLVRWYHAIPYGDYSTPNEIAINFQKVEGTDHIRQLHGGYVLDRTTDGITSYAMEQWVDADEYGTDNASSDLQANFQRLRQGAPNTSALPATAPVPIPYQ